MATRAALVRSILKELGCWQSGQDLAPEDFRAIDEELPYRMAAMAKAEIYTVDDLEHIPDEALSEIARYMAGEFSQTFGISDTELASVQQNAGLAERALRFQRTRRPTYSRMRAEYF
jgi:hypothetical protein